MQTFSQRKERVPSDFNRVAHRYDLLNRLNPGYSKHLRWSARRMELHPGAKILDLCCGTGLSTDALAKTYPSADITGLDGSEGMLDIARRKTELAGIEFLLGDAMDPEVAGARGPYDGILMAYGIRNMSNPDLCLERLLPLLRPGAVIAFHEYSVRDSRLAKAVWNTVAGTVIIPFGVAATRSSELFQYLRRSVNEFDGVGAFKERLAHAGFVHITESPMDGWQRGIVHTFLARRPI